jgi:NAD(P)-dependent dehydrogenase (short-subunit alcohol dehydrogenase family)
MHKDGKQRRVWVTGASSGIGAACVEALSAAGWEVWASFREPSQAAKATQGNVRGLVLDLEDPRSLEKMGEVLRENSGVEFDALVHAAGYVEPGLLEWIEPADLRRQLEVNVVGAHAVTRTLLPALRTRRGRVIWISSTSGRVALPGIGAYAASKFALEAMADAWRIETADDGITFTLIEPGPVDTPIWDKADRSLVRWAGKVPEQDLEVFRQAMRESQSRSIPMSRVTGAILRTLDSCRPPARILMGSDSWIVVLLRRVPDGLRDVLVTLGYRAKKKRFRPHT